MPGWSIETMVLIRQRTNVDVDMVTGLHRAAWMAGIAQLAERQVVVLDVAGSSPVARPTPFL